MISGNWAIAQLTALLWSALKRSWCLWTCHLANVLQWTYNKAQVLLEVGSSAILGLISSNQFMSYPQWLCHSFKGCGLPPSLLSQKEWERMETVRTCKVNWGLSVVRELRCRAACVVKYSETLHGVVKSVLLFQNYWGCLLKMQIAQLNSEVLNPCPPG